MFDELSRLKLASLACFRQVSPAVEESTTYCPGTLRSPVDGQLSRFHERSTIHRGGPPHSNFGPLSMDSS